MDTSSFSAVAEAFGRPAASASYIYHPWMDTLVRATFAATLSAVGIRMWFYGEPSGYTGGAFIPDGEAVPVGIPAALVRQSSSVEKKNS